MFDLTKKTQHEKDAEKVRRYVKRFVAKYVPERYNQLKMLAYLLDEDYDHYISISNRADGKSYNYTHFFMRFAIDFDMRFILVARHYTLQKSYVNELKEIANQFSDSVDPKYLTFQNSDLYVKVSYNGKPIALITDLNEVSDLKYESSVLAHYPIILFDEFLVFEQEYLPDEYSRLKLLYSSIDRKDSRDIIKMPKLFYLGNAVNFSSPILMGLNMFNKIENQPMNSIKTYGNKVLEINKNEHANKKRNMRAFDEENDALANVEFTTNNYLIANDNQLKNVEVYGSTLYIKLRDNFLRVKYNYDKGLYILSLVGFSKKYEYNILRSDTRKDSIWLAPKFYSDSHAKRYLKGIYLFENSFTRLTVLNDENIMALKIINIVAYQNIKDEEDTKKFDKNKLEDMYLSKTKKKLFERFANDTIS